MPDYKKMYFDLFRATEAAIGTLIEAQQRCEEMLLEEPEPPAAAPVCGGRHASGRRKTGRPPAAAAPFAVRWLACGCCIIDSFRSFFLLL